MVMPVVLELNCPELARREALREVAAREYADRAARHSETRRRVMESELRGVGAVGSNGQRRLRRDGVGGFSS